MNKRTRYYMSSDDVVVEPLGGEAPAPATLQELQAAKPATAPARPALTAPPQAELLAVKNVGDTVVKRNVHRPTGVAVRDVKPRS